MSAVQSFFFGLAVGVPIGIALAVALLAAASIIDRANARRNSK